MTEKVSYTIYRPDKKTIAESESPQIEILPQFPYMSEKKFLNLLTQLLQFTDQQIR